VRTRAARAVPGLLGRGLFVLLVLGAAAQILLAPYRRLEVEIHAGAFLSLAMGWVLVAPRLVERARAGAGRWLDVLAFDLALALVLAELGPRTARALDARRPLRAAAPPGGPAAGSQPASGGRDAPGLSDERARALRRGVRAAQAGARARGVHRRLVQRQHRAAPLPLHDRGRALLVRSEVLNLGAGASGRRSTSCCWPRRAWRIDPD
jgi:hypothetical protein